MSAAIRRRLNDLQAARAKQEQRKAGNTYLDDMRQFLQSVDGQAELGKLPGETLWDTMVRRVQTVDGWTLAGIPGDTLEAKIKAVDDACQNKVAVSAEARHAARHWFSMYEGL